MQKRVLVTARTFGKVAKEPLDLFASPAYELLWNPHDHAPTEEEYQALVGGVSGLIVGGEKVPGSVIEAAGALRVISVHGVGADNIDLKTASARKVLVCNAPGANTNAVAELALGLLLASARRIPHADREVKSGRWGQCIGTEIAGKVLGIVGLGRIGKSLARKVRGLEMRVLAFDIVLDQDFLRQEGVEAVSLDELLSRSDFVSLHCPLTPGTENLIGDPQLKKMKRTAHLINLSRGRVVNEPALIRALEEGWIAGAATDVYSAEPPAGSPLLTMEGMVTTMHMGAHSREALAQMGQIAARNVIDALEGRRPKYLVNPEVWPEARS